jgi:YHS domain-containing protein
MKKAILLVAFIVAGTVSLLAQKPEIFSTSNQAIKGYDPVGYFTEGKPVKGDEHFTYRWKDATRYFSSKHNLDLFKENPEKYAPQYGGYCAYGMSEGHKASTEPDAWTIVNGKLYLNNSLKVKGYWMKDQAPRIERADKNWPEVKDKE